MQFHADDGRLGKATKLHKALKVLIPRSMANNSKGYTMALNAAAVWIYWVLKRYRKPSGFSCWSWTPYQTLQATLFYLCASSRNVCSVWKKQSYGNTTDWLILKSNREQNSDVSPEPCGRELVERHWCVVKTLSVEPEAVASPSQTRRNLSPRPGHANYLSHTQTHDCPAHTECSTGFIHAILKWMSFLAGN